MLFTVENSIQNGLHCDNCFSLLSSHPLHVHDEVIKLLQAIAYENILQYKNNDWKFVSNFLHELMHEIPWDFLFF